MTEEGKHSRVRVREENKRETATRIACSEMKPRQKPPHQTPAPPKPGRKDRLIRKQHGLSSVMTPGRKEG